LLQKECPVNFEERLQRHESKIRNILSKLANTRIIAKRLLSAERTSLGETGLSTSGLAENGSAGSADNDGLGVGEDGGDVEASRALNVHEERAGSRHKGL
jgi:hypothetical protein